MQRHVASADTESYAGAHRATWQGESGVRDSELRDRHDRRQWMLGRRTLCLVRQHVLAPVGPAGLARSECSTNGAVNWEVTSY